MKLSVGQRILIGLGVVELLAVGLGVFTIYETYRARQIELMLKLRDFAVQRTIYDVSNKQRTVHMLRERALTQYLYRKAPLPAGAETLKGDPVKTRDEWSDLHGTMSTSLTSLRDQAAKYALDGASAEREHKWREVSANAARAEEARIDLQQATATLFDLLEKEKYDQLDAQLREVTQRRETFDRQLGDGVKLVNQATEIGDELSRQTYFTTWFSAVVGLMVMLALGLVAGLFIRRSVTRPLGQFLRFVEQAIRGNLAPTVPTFDVREFEQLGRSLHLLLTRLNQGFRAAGNTPSPAPRAAHTAPFLAQLPNDFLAPPQGKDQLGRLGPYGVLKVLGSGGMGVVFQARDTNLQRLVALKVMLPALASPSDRERFLREARAVAALKHDHIVTIYHVGEERDTPFMAMELLEGESLETRLQREGKLPLDETLRIGRETCEALAAAHDKGLIHRDVKPGNIWLEGMRGRVKILDFGLVRESREGGHLTLSGAIVGTPAFMAPEQASGRPVDNRCDLFSLGGVLYLMITGEQPFQGEDPISLLVAVTSSQPKTPRQLDRGVPTALSALVMRLLEKDPARRPESAWTLIADLDAVKI